MNYTELSTLRARIKRTRTGITKTEGAIDSIARAEGEFLKALDEGLAGTVELFKNMEALAYAINRGEEIMRNIIEFCETQGYIKDKDEAR